MSDEDLVRGFEAAELPAGEFTHAAHVRIAWWYLRHTSLPDALVRFTAALKRYAASLGAADKYHETITVAYMLLIAEGLAGAAHLTWPEFAGRNPDLLCRTPSVLSTYYGDALLFSKRSSRARVPARHRGRADRGVGGRARRRPWGVERDPAQSGHRLVRRAGWPLHGIPGRRVVRGGRPGSDRGAPPSGPISA